MISDICKLCNHKIIFKILPNIKYIICGGCSNYRIIKDVVEIKEVLYFKNVDVRNFENRCTITGNSNNFFLCIENCYIDNEEKLNTYLMLI